MNRNEIDNIKDEIANTNIHRYFEEGKYELIKDKVDRILIPEYSFIEKNELCGTFLVSFRTLSIIVDDE